jgi:hypothetical protein
MRTQVAFPIFGSESMSSLAGKLNAFLQSLNPFVRETIAIGNPWTRYTPVWASTGTQPAIGNGLLAGAWTRAGRLVHVQIRMDCGSTTTFGTGAYSWSLPFPIVSGFGVGSTIVLGVGGIGDASGPDGYVARATSQNDGGGSVCFLYVNGVGNTGLVGQAYPFTWANGDKMHAGLTYMCVEP